MPDGDLAFFDAGGEGGVDGGVAELLALQVDDGFEALYFLDEVASLVDGGVVASFCGVVTGLGLIEIGLGADALVTEFTGALVALFGVLKVGFGAADVGGPASRSISSQTSFTRKGLARTGTPEKLSNTPSAP